MLSGLVEMAFVRGGRDGWVLGEGFGIETGESDEVLLKCLHYSVDMTGENSDTWAKAMRSAGQAEWG
jgi:hypothetical protein